MTTRASQLSVIPVVPPASPVHCEKAARLLHARAGLILGEHKAGATQRALMRLAQHYTGGDADRFLGLLEDNALHPAWAEFINAFTINHTAFFREPHHFERLARYFISKPDGCEVWCASAASGEEPYSIAMVANEVYGEDQEHCAILATDIDTDALQRAAEGIYATARVADLDQARLKQHFLKGIEAQMGRVRVRACVQSRVAFLPLNLNDPTWPAIGPFDVVFCRNTMIYFDRDTQRRLIARFAQVTRPGGLLFVGHSENISALTSDFRLLSQTVYQRM